MFPLGVKSCNYRYHPTSVCLGLPAIIFNTTCIGIWCTFWLEDGRGSNGSQSGSNIHGREF